MLYCPVVESKIVPSMQVKLREAARDGRKADIIELLKHDGVDVDSPNWVSQSCDQIMCTCTCMSEGEKWDVWIVL